MTRAADLAALAGSVNTSGALAATNLSGTLAKTVLPSGSILQVINAVSTSTDLGNSSTSTWADTSLTATITPTSATSKILVLFSQNGVNRQTGPGGVRVRLLRGGTSLNEYAGSYGAAWQSGAVSTENGVGSVSGEQLDSPATTSPVTYKTQFLAGVGTSGGGVAYVQHGGAVSTMILLEVSA